MSSSIRPIAEEAGMLGRLWRMFQRKLTPAEDEQKVTRKAARDLEALQKKNWTQEQRLRIVEKRVLRKR